MIYLLVTALMVISLLSFMVGHQVVESGTQVIVLTGSSQRLRIGPTSFWYVKLFDKLTTVDVSERALDITVPSCPVRDSPPASIDLTIVYHITDARYMAPIDKFEQLLNALVQSVARRLSLAYSIQELRTSDDIINVVFDRIDEPARQRSFSIVEVMVRRVSGMSPHELAMTTEGVGAKRLGKEGLYLRYLESIKLLAESPGTRFVFLPGLADNPELVAELLHLDEER